ncbi:uncharacterized protein LOC110232929 [Exaiptasia diaphana]|uniref:Tox-ART-HYD1 domain-containing protein n=1 Tax=Exaiptasia diaphana TaxID=2652724 RepID=A0A913WTC1_EXADI|nr:uncharacterized protein LOC110232929 [Exaiptasia diaphana]KXJ27911.1 hypothetical protein AC249_AIPGENE2925 [Exaiptasia diaphana]
MSSHEGKTLYHYTDEEGAEGIQNSGVIKESRSERGDAAFGSGVYLNDLPPSTPDNELLVNNYDSAPKETDANNVSHVVEIKVPQDKMQNFESQSSSRVVYKHPGDLHLKDYDAKVYKKNATD